MKILILSMLLVSCSNYSPEKQELSFPLTQNQEETQTIYINNQSVFTYCVNQDKMISRKVEDNSEITRFVIYKTENGCSLDLSAIKKNSYFQIVIKK